MFIKRFKNGRYPFGPEMGILEFIKACEPLPRPRQMLRPAHQLALRIQFALGSIWISVSTQISSPEIVGPAGSKQFPIGCAYKSSLTVAEPSKGDVSEKRRFLVDDSIGRSDIATGQMMTISKA